MIFILLILFAILSFNNVKSTSYECKGNISNSQITSLYDLYQSTNGINWNWQNTSIYGNIWSFDDSDILSVNPCFNEWQGISCNCTISNEIKIISINLSNYGLNGSIPSSFFNLTDLIALNLENNLLVSKIPNEISNLVNIIEISLYSNMLSNTIPSSIERLTNLQYLSLYDNNLIGEIPDSWSNLVNIETLYLFSNRFTGTIPTSIGQLTNIIDFWLYSNQLSGTIPKELGNLINIQKLYLNHNILTGTIPNTLISLNELISIDLSANLLIGQIPNFIINYPKLRSISMVTNCFTGSFPELTCNNSQLTTIVMDGLASSTSCPENSYLNSHKPGFVNGYTQSNIIRGSIPSCVWSLDNLTSLHLSGNGLKGQLYDISEYSNLNDLSLSHNQISGTIPLSIQKHYFSQRFDVSSNRITGILSNDFKISNSQNILQLSVNRISGNLPDEFYSLSTNMTTFDVLVGNRYNCKNNIPPKGDPNSGLYSCASTDLDTAIFSWVIFLCVLIVVCLFLLYIGFRYMKKFKIDYNNVSSFNYCYKIYLQINIKITKYLHDCSLIVIRTYDWWNEITLLNLTYITRTNAGTIDIRETVLFLEYSRIIGYWSIIILLFLIVFYLPFNLIINLSNDMSNKSVQVQYGWVISSAYLKGFIPLIFIGFTLSLILMKIKYDCNYYRIQALKYLISFNNNLFNVNNRLTMNDINVLPSDNKIGVNGNVNGNSTETNVNNTNMPLDSNNDHNKIIRSTNNTIIYNKSNIFRYILTFYIISLVLQSFNFGITLFVNILYVVSVIDDSSLTATNYLFLQCFIGFFKFFWSVTYIPIAMNILVYYNYHITTCMKNRYIMLLVNYILSPCIATLFQNQSCFYYIFKPYSLITATFSDTVCNYSYVSSSQTIECTSTSIENFHASFTPPFLYSYHCGSALLTTYVPVLLYSYSLQGMIIPIIRYILLRNPSLRRKLLPFRFLRDYHTNSLLAQDDGRVVLDGKATLVTLMLHLTMLLSFGLTHPLLGFAVVFTILAEVLTHKLTMGKFLFITKLFESRKKNDMTFRSTNYDTELPRISIADVMQLDTESYNNDDYNIDDSVPVVNNPLHNESMDKPEVIVEPGIELNKFDNLRNIEVKPVQISKVPNRGKKQKSIEIGIETSDILKDKNDRNTNESIDDIKLSEAADVNSQTYALVILESSNRDSWAAVHSCVWYLIFTVTLFWGLIFFDMISDGYGVRAGIVTIVLLAGVLPTFIFISGRLYYNKYVTKLYKNIFRIPDARKRAVSTSINNTRISANITILNNQNKSVAQLNDSLENSNDKQEKHFRRHSSMMTLPFSQTLILNDNNDIDNTIIDNMIHKHSISMQHDSTIDYNI